MFVKKESVTVNLVRILSVTDNSISQDNVGKVFFDLSVSELGEEVSKEYCLLKNLNESEHYIDIARDNIELEVVGFIQSKKSPLALPIRSQCHEFQADNTENDIFILGAFSQINNLRYLQITENILVGYNSIHPDDKHSFNNRTGINADIYNLVKIGELDKKPIYYYLNDLVYKDYSDEVSINWIGSFENHRGEDIPTNCVIHKIK